MQFATSPRNMASPHLTLMTLEAVKASAVQMASLRASKDSKDAEISLRTPAASDGIRTVHVLGGRG